MNHNVVAERLSVLPYTVIPFMEVMIPYMGLNLVIVPDGSAATEDADPPARAAVRGCHVQEPGHAHHDRVRTRRYPQTAAQEQGYCFILYRLASYTVIHTPKKY